MSPRKSSTAYLDDAEQVRRQNGISVARRDKVCRAHGLVELGDYHREEAHLRDVKDAAHRKRLDH